MARLRFIAPLLPALTLSLGLVRPAVAADIDASDLDDDQADEESAPSEEAEPSDASASVSPVTTSPVDQWDPNDLQFELGVRARMLVVPKFLINAFQVEGGQDVVVGGIGAEGGIAKGNFEGLLGIWYAGYNAGPMPFKGPTDPPQAWELIKSNLGMLYLTADLMLRGEITRGWHWYFGGGAGIGILTGTLQRNEALWVTSPDGQTTLVPCSGPIPFPTQGWDQCPDPMNEDNRYDLAYGLSSPYWPVYPWLTMQTGVRYQPTQHLITRLDLGIGSSGFWFGLAVDYGL